MQLRTFNVPFARILPPEAGAEISFSADDYLVVRPLFTLPTSDVRLLSTRLETLTPESPEADADTVVLDLLRSCVVEWHLSGETGSIPMPRTVVEFNALPAVLRGAFFGFLTAFRGDGPNPTPPA